MQAWHGHASQPALLRNSTKQLMSAWSKSKKAQGNESTGAIHKAMSPVMLPDAVDDITESSAGPPLVYDVPSFTASSLYFHLYQKRSLPPF